jgi:hypothetical protein
MSLPFNGKRLWILLFPPTLHKKKGQMNGVTLSICKANGAIRLSTLATILLLLLQVPKSTVQSFCNQSARCLYQLILDYGCSFKQTHAYNIERPDD